MTSYYEIEHPAAYEAAVKRNIINNAKKTFFKRDRAEDVINWLYNNEGRSEFARSLLLSFNTYGKLSDGQFAAVVKCVDTDEAKRAEWKAKKLAESANSDYVGEVGTRIKFTVKVSHVITLEGYYGNSYIYLLDDAKGNRIVYKGTAILGDKGEKLKFIATIKEHKLHDGGKQTVIARPSKIETIQTTLAA